MSTAKGLQVLERSRQLQPVLLRSTTKSSGSNGIGGLAAAASAGLGVPPHRHPADIESTSDVLGKRLPPLAAFSLSSPSLANCCTLPATKKAACTSPAIRSVLAVPAPSSECA